MLFFSPSLDYIFTAKFAYGSTSSSQRSHFCPQKGDILFVIGDYNFVKIPRRFFFTEKVLFSPGISGIITYICAMARTKCPKLFSYQDASGLKPAFRNNKYGLCRTKIKIGSRMQYEL